MAAFSTCERVPELWRQQEEGDARDALAHYPAGALALRTRTAPKVHCACTH